ncbi:J domain-containing protein [Agaribacterium sp. ZY112]|uniref:J domain-containing protein n=1 Tax=Agaribacterium sp. ZY112 TaxID=3233574 RepID=UPI00352634C3
MLRASYQILGLDEAATDAEIKQAWRRLSAFYHPDRNKQSVVATEMFKIVQQAYAEVLASRDTVEQAEESSNNGARSCRRKRQGSRSQRRFHWQLPEHYIGTNLKCEA